MDTKKTNAEVRRQKSEENRSLAVADVFGCAETDCGNLAILSPEFCLLYSKSRRDFEG
jgi:hypothetical protein